MNERVHLENLGRLVTNIQTLEVTIRACLFEDELAKGISKQLSNVKFVKGELLPESAYTNWDTLSELIRKYNELPISKGLTIDENIVDIRDAMAHGRVFSFAPEGIPMLVRFNKPKNNQVEVEFGASMTEQWFGEQIARLFKEFRKVDEVHKKQRTGK